MPEITTYRKNGIHYTDFQRQVVKDVDVVEGRELFIRTNVSDGVYAILQFGDIQKHDEQSKKLLGLSK